MSERGRLSFFKQRVRMQAASVYPRGLVALLDRYCLATKWAGQKPELAINRLICNGLANVDRSPPAPGSCPQASATQVPDRSKPVPFDPGKDQLTLARDMP